MSKIFYIVAVMFFFASTVVCSCSDDLSCLRKRNEERLHEIEQNQELINAKLDKLIEIFNTKKTTYSNDGYIGLTSLSKNFDPKKEQGGPPHRPGATARVEI
ncbi:uncharacterized protein LOC110856955 [Folsomia candida]|uniref:uncharacterized protein LOC110856955 n=1 Tax=Folsomia candida TaxID=158441 RepID=UPI000B90A365|nr:uncharacterized protein LOC110856955 [Folsomia candida]